MFFMGITVALQPRKQKVEKRDLRIDKKCEKSER